MLFRAHNFSNSHRIHSYALRRNQQFARVRSLGVGTDPPWWGRGGRGPWGIEEEGWALVALR